MRALQGTFTRLKSRLTSDKEVRGVIILCIILLHNYRTEFVGLNQIATVFNEHYEQLIKLDNYDRIARYYDNDDNYD
jgi:mannitol/fructose-specific phosphotransferase system IIA component (Ntr-type)